MDTNTLFRLLDQTWETFDKDGNRPGREVYNAKSDWGMSTVTIGCFSKGECDGGYTTRLFWTLPSGKYGDMTQTGANPAIPGGDFDPNDVIRMIEQMKQGFNPKLD
jgi:hypothetical protein